MNSTTTLNTQCKTLMTDFSQGDPKVGVNISKNSTDSQKEPDEIETDFLKERQRLTGSTEETEESQDSDSWNEDGLKSAQSRHVTFKTCSKQSISDLRKESRTLLSIRSAPIIPTGLDNAISDIHKSATIFELCWDDRQRVGQLIGELASSQERIQALEGRLERSAARETKYKEKSSDLMKKLDVLGEKTHRLENEKYQMKEKHLSSLSALQNKIATISDQFEASIKEIQRLKLENQNLKMETASGQAKTSTLETQVKVAQETNLQTKALLEAAMKREKTFKTQIKELTDQLEQNIQEEKVRKKIAKELESRLKSEAKQLQRMQTESENAYTANSKPIFSPARHSEKITKPPEAEVQLGSPVVDIRDKSIEGVEQKEKDILQDLFFRF